MGENWQKEEYIRKYWQWIFISCLASPPTRALPVRIFWLSVSAQQNITMLENKDNILWKIFCNGRSYRQHFPLPCDLNPILGEFFLRKVISFSAGFPITRRNPFLHLPLVNNGVSGRKLLIAVLLHLHLSHSSTHSKPSQSHSQAEWGCKSKDPPKLGLNGTWTRNFCVGTGYLKFSLELAQVPGIQVQVQKFLAGKNMEN